MRSATNNTYPILRFIVSTSLLNLHQTKADSDTIRNFASPTWYSSKGTSNVTTSAYTHTITNKRNFQVCIQIEFFFYKKFDIFDFESRFGTLCRWNVLWCMSLVIVILKQKKKRKPVMKSRNLLKECTESGTLTMEWVPNTFFNRCSKRLMRPLTLAGPN